MGKQVKAVLFDLDGVLVDTRILHYEALSKALRDIGIELSLETHHRIYDGLPTYKKIEMLSETYQLSTEQIEFLNSKKQQYTTELLTGKIRPREELIRIFSLLKNMNISTAVCSNTKRTTLDFIIKNLGIHEYLNFTLSNEDVKEPKPSPEIYLKAMKILNVTPSQTLIFEDSPHGLESAQKSKAIVEKVSSISDLSYERVLKLVS